MKLICTLLLLCSCLTSQAGWMFTNITSAWWEMGPSSIQGPNLLTSNAFTISAWFTRKIDRGLARAVLIAKGQTQPTPEADSISYELSVRTNHLQFRYSPPGAGVIHTWQVSDTAPNTNELAHVVLKFTYGTPSSMVMFVNGTNASGSWIVGDGTDPGTNTTKTMMFGQNVLGTPFMGSFNDIAIWASMLSNLEMQLLYSTRLKRYPMMVSPSTLIGYWPLDGWPENKGPSTEVIPFAINMKEGQRFYGSSGNLGIFIAVNEREHSYPPNE